jgi:hypothetical protein
MNSIRSFGRLANGDRLGRATACHWRDSELALGHDDPLVKLYRGGALLTCRAGCVVSTLGGSKRVVNGWARPSSTSFGPASSRGTRDLGMS